MPPKYSKGYTPPPPSLTKRTNDPLLCAILVLPLAFLAVYLLGYVILEGHYGQYDPVILKRCFAEGRKTYGTDMGIEGLDDWICMLDHFFRLVVSTDLGKGLFLQISSIFVPITLLALFESGSPGVSIFLGPWTWLATWTIGEFIGIGPVTALIFIPAYVLARLTGPRTLTAPSTPPSIIYFILSLLHGAIVLLSILGMVIYPSYFTPSKNIGSLSTSDESHIFSHEIVPGFGWKQLSLIFLYSPLTVLPLILYRPFLSGSLPVSKADSGPPEVPKDQPFPPPTIGTSLLWLSGAYFIYKGVQSGEKIDDGIWFLIFDTILAALSLVTIYLLERFALDNHIGRGPKPALKWGYVLIGGPGALIGDWLAESKVVGLNKVKPGTKVQ